MSDTSARLSRLLVGEYKVPAERLRPEVELESLGLDSLATVELLWTIEETFGVKLPKAPVIPRTLDELVRFVDALVLAQPGGAAAPGTPPASRSP